MSNWQSTIWFAFAAIVFALAYTQAPLYYSNQNQYFLHGLAQAGRGYLADDWLANTADPTPIFTPLVAFTALYLNDYLFHIYYVLFLGIYVVSLLGIWSALSEPRPSLVQQFALLAGVTLVHSALLRWLSCQLFGVDYPWYFQAGLAGQYLLGSMFQPSVFGVILLLSIWLFLLDRPYSAAAAASLTGILHSTYLLLAAVLVLGYLLVLVREGRWRQALGSGGLALVLVLPAVGFVLRTFGPTTPETAAEAQAIIVYFRVPHHGRIDRWLDVIGVLQVLWVVAAMLLVRRTRLFPILLVSFVVSLGLSVWQWLTGSSFLAMLFPWRISTYLVPLATTIIVGKLVMWLIPEHQKSSRSWEAEAPAEPNEQNPEVGTDPERNPSLPARQEPRPLSPWRATFFPWIAASFILVTCAVAGVVIMEKRLGYLRNDAELPVYEYVQSHLDKGQVYLVPYKLPKPPAAPGSSSNDFLLEDDQTGRRIPLEMQRFRLHAGAPILIDFKAIPYRDDEVLEWRRRLDVGLQIYADLEAGRFDAARPELDRYGVTHIVALRSQGLSSPQLQAVYEDKHYVIYRILPAKPGV